MADFYVSDEMKSLIESLHNSSLPDSGFFAETWSSSLFESLGTSSLLSDALNAVGDTNTTFPNNGLGRQLQTVARLIATREERGVDTDMFYVEIGGVSSQ